MRPIFTFGDVKPRGGRLVLKRGIIYLLWERISHNYVCVDESMPAILSWWGPDVRIIWEVYECFSRSRILRICVLCERDRALNADVILTVVLPPKLGRGDFTFTRLRVEMPVQPMVRGAPEYWISPYSRTSDNRNRDSNPRLY